jgi:hypothetical protein
MLLATAAADSSESPATALYVRSRLLNAMPLAIRKRSDGVKEPLKRAILYVNTFVQSTRAPAPIITAAT